MKQANLSSPLTCVTADTVEAFIKSAKARIRFAKAGLFKREAEAIVGAASRQVDCRLFIEAGEDAVRLGLADKDGLALVAGHLAELHVRTVDKIRMAILLVDEQVLVYFPLALAWESESEGINFPNGLLGGQDLAAQILKLIDGESAPEAVPQSVGPFTLAQFCPTDAEETRVEIDESLKSLEKDPPPDPTRLRQMTVYRNLFKLVRMTEKGVELAEKKISLARLNRHVPGADGRLLSSWRVMDKRTEGGIPEVAAYKKAMERLKQQFVHPMGRFGLLVKASEKHAFRCGAAKLVEELNARLCGEVAQGAEDPGAKSEDIPRLSKQDRQDEVLFEVALAKGISVPERLKQDREALISYISGVIAQNPRLIEDVFSKEELKALKAMEKALNLPADRIAPNRLEFFVTKCLRFPEAADIVGKAGIVTDFYDVSDELLDSEEFRKLLEKPGILLEQLRKSDLAYEESAPALQIQPR